MKSICLSLFLAAAASMQDVVYGSCLRANATGSCVYVSDPNATFVGKTTTNSDGILVDNFLGIKYGTFDERFAPSQPLMLSASDGPLLVNATEYGPECPYPSSTSYDEDCLYLNIYRPSQQKEDSLAVMVWIFGGSWVEGAGSRYDGSNLAGNEDVVVVTMNYRLGVFGFVPIDPEGSGGMNGLLDTVTALKWVKDYIEYFGGDPNKVTVFGQSAGGINTCFLSVCPVAKGLFQRAILQSGQCAALTASVTQEESQDQLEGVLQEMNCTSPPCTIEDLKSLTTEELLVDPYFRFFLSIDPAVLPAYPVDLFREGKINPTDMIIGANTVDNGDVLGYLFTTPESWTNAYSSFEVLRDPMHSRVDVSDSVLNDIQAAYSPDKYGGSIVSATNHAMGDMNFLCYSRELAAIAASKVEGKVYQYILGFNSGIEFANITGLLNATDIDDTYWSSHSADLPYVFGYPGVNELPINIMPDETIDLSKEMMSRWAKFAKTGNPQSNISPVEWEPVPNNSYNPSSSDAVDTPYLNFTGEGGLWVESNEDKSTQCTAVIPAEPTFLGADPGSGAAGVSCMLNRATVACSTVALFGFMLI
eukprot:scaffold13251_cov78-Cyclotella_meneghiniana.AAC.3